MIFAYLTQLRLYDEERARHDGKPFKTRHTYLLVVALVLVFASAAFFLIGGIGRRISPKQTPITRTVRFSQHL
jgi:hypothetical protein